MHAQHAKEMLVRCRQRAKPHQRQSGWPASHMNKVCQQLGGARAGIDQTAAAIDHRTLGTDHHVHSGADSCRVRLGRRPVACGCRCADDLLLIRGLLHQDVFRKIDQDRAGATGCGNMKCLDHGGLQFGALFHQVVMLGTGTGDAGCVGLLKGIIADQVGWHLAGQADHRHGIHQRVCQAGNRVGGTGAGCNENNAGLAGRTGITLGGMDCRLLVTNKDVLDLVVLEQSVIDRKNGTTGIAEHDFYTLVLKSLKQKLCSRHHRCGCGGAVSCVFCCRCGFGHRPIPCFVTSWPSAVLAFCRLLPVSHVRAPSRRPESVCQQQEMGAHHRFGRCDPCAGWSYET